jgi:hypothetical protein
MATKKKSLKKKSPAVDTAKLKRWSKQGVVLAKAKEGNQWAIGDWILAGVNEFGTKKAYDEAQEATGMTRDTLYQFKFIAECFPISTRVKDLYFGHHRLVAKEEFTPDERKRLLKHAQDNDESVASFEAWLRNRKIDAARRADKRSPADQAADKTIGACDVLLRNYTFDTLMTTPPSATKRKSVLTTLRDAATKLNKLAEEMEQLWCEHDSAEEDFERGTSSESNKALGVVAGQ